MVLRLCSCLPGPGGTHHSAHCSGGCRAGVQRATQFATVVTDLTTCHNTWFHPQVNQCFVATREARRRAMMMGLKVGPCRSCRVLGPVCTPSGWTPRWSAGLWQLTHSFVGLLDASRRCPPLCAGRETQAPSGVKRHLTPHGGAFLQLAEYREHMPACPVIQQVQAEQGGRQADQVLAIKVKSAAASAPAAQAGWYSQLACRQARAP